MDLTKIRLQDFASGGMFQAFDGFFLYLANPFAREIKLLTDFFKGMLMLAIQAKV